MMIRNNLCRLGSAKIVETISPCFYNPLRFFSKQNNEPKEMHFNDQQATYYTAKDVEFCPNRAKDVMQNHVQETSDACSEESAAETAKFDSGASESDKDDMNRYQSGNSVSDKDHMNMYQSGNSVSLHSVMQSNVPEPFASKGKSPTHLNMPGSSSNQDCKYLSGKIQSTHQSKQ